MTPAEENLHQIAENSLTDPRNQMGFGIAGPGTIYPMIEMAPTLRDQFAMAALHRVSTAKFFKSFEERAAWCYRMADACLAERAKK